MENVSRALRLLNTDHHRMERWGQKEKAEKFLETVPEVWDGMVSVSQKTHGNAFREILGSQELISLRDEAIQKLSRVVFHTTRISPELVGVFIRNVEPERVELFEDEDKDLVYGNLLWVVASYPRDDDNVLNVAIEKLTHLLGRPLDSEMVEELKQKAPTLREARLLTSS
jgi:hypothetical protein